MSVLLDQKQACLDLSNAALAFFDLLDEHGEEGPWTANGGVEIIVRLADAYEAATTPTHRRATQRMMALAMRTDDPGKLLTTFGMLGQAAEEDGL
jgi:hypothetical protein